MALLFHLDFMFTINVFFGNESKAYSFTDFQRTPALNTIMTNLGVLFLLKTVKKRNFKLFSRYLNLTFSSFLKFKQNRLLFV